VSEYAVLWDYSDWLDPMIIFTFGVDVTGTISEMGTSLSTMLFYINK
jgi:hypothetical protein